MDEQNTRYIEESFGVLTDDDIYLDCILVLPAGLRDEDVRALRVWVPRYPLTKSSLITCARQEVQAQGSTGRVAHLVFDLRTTGDSEGQKGDLNFEADLEGIRLWAEERFGNIGLSFLGTARGTGRVTLTPIRPGVVVETNTYQPKSRTNRPPIVYLSTYGNFSPVDDIRCAVLAQSGYPVFGFDPLRYLLHASVRGRLQAVDIWQDFLAFCKILPGRPLLIGQPIAAGVALFIAAGVEAVRGVIAIGQTQAAFRPTHIFKNDNPHTYFLGRHVHKIPPRPVSLVIQESHPLGGNADDMAPLYQVINGPRQLLNIREITPDFLLEQLAWLENAYKP